MLIKESENIVTQSSNGGSIVVYGIPSGWKLQINESSGISTQNSFKALQKIDGATYSYSMSESSGTVLYDDFRYERNGAYYPSGISYGFDGAIPVGKSILLPSGSFGADISIPAIDLGSGSFSVELLWNPSGSASGICPELIVTDSSTGMNQVRLYNHSYVSSGWHHIVWVINRSSSGYMYIDGISSGTFAIPSGMGSVSGGLMILPQYTNSNQIQNLAIYPSALTQSQISAHHSSISTSYPSSGYGIAVSHLSFPISSIELLDSSGYIREQVTTANYSDLSGKYIFRYGRRRQKNLLAKDRPSLQVPNATAIWPTTESGWETYAPGSGRLFLPSATNYCTNPIPLHISDAIPSGWSRSGTTNSTWTLSNGSRYKGTTSKHINVVGMSGVGVYAGIIFRQAVVNECVSGDVYTISFDIGEISLIGCVLRLRVQWINSAGTEIGQSNVSITPTDTFIRFAATVVAPDGANRFQARVETNNFQEGDSFSFSICNILVEKSSILTPYFDGSSPNCSWSGTPHASVSVRAASKETMGFPVGISKYCGTIAAKEIPLYSSSQSSVQIPISTTTSLMARFLTSTTTGNKTVRFYDGAWKTASVTGLSWNIGSSLIQIARWSSGNLDLNVNGTNSSQVIYIPSAMQDFTALCFNALGGIYDTSSYIGSTIISPKRKSDYWVEAIQASSGAAFNDPYTLWRDFMEPGDLLIPMNGNGISYLKTSDDADYDFISSSPTTDSGYRIFS
jgi:hypothetical protein